MSWLAYQPPPFIPWWMRLLLRFIPGKVTQEDNVAVTVKIFRGTWYITKEVVLAQRVGGEGE